MSERKIVDYKIEWEDSTSDLTTRVWESLKKGYQPIGGVCVARTNVIFNGNEIRVIDMYHQAMVKYED